MLLHSFLNEISQIPLPEKFTFPFYYEPHELSSIAAKELQNYLESQTDFEHNFGLDKNQNGLEIGKMFGVLVVQKQNGTLGSLWAFSGKLADQNHLANFVPTVFDMLDENGFYKKGEEQLNKFNKKIDELENQIEYLDAINQLKETKNQSELELYNQKQKIKSEKTHRDYIRKINSNLIPEELKNLEFELSEASKKERIILKKMMQYWNYKITDAQENVLKFKTIIDALKEQRKNLSASVQLQLFENYSFLNQYGDLKNLGEIFNQNPPAGAGECAAPKLLHYAFQHQLKPIAMAEFWWGKSPKSEVRQHKNFYPACTGKCEPILNHMLTGIETEVNPFKINAAQGKEITIVYEDEHLALINKPEEFLSVPGKLITDSVLSRVKSRFPDATGPMIVHRLDMSTSGLLIIAKSEYIYKKIQAQFITRKVKKRYVALLDGILKKESGTINLPLRVDLDNRPNQIVCFEYGKEAKTSWEVIKRYKDKTLVYFYPITGRTHQLRVHAAHRDGLNCPIVGDDLYGKKSNRLHLHAEQISFEHPITKEFLTFTKEASF